MRILLVDDYRDAAAALAELLHLAGHEVRIARSSTEAALAVREFRPALVLTDLLFPHEPGPALVRRLRVETGERPVRILALTGLAPGHGEALAQAAGCDGYLLKPVTLEALSPYLE